MQVSFPSVFYTENRKRLFDDLPAGSLVVIGGAGLLQKSSDTTFPFAQQSSFWYLTGIEEPNIVLCMTAEESYCILPVSNDTLALFDGAPVVDELATVSGIATILAYDEGWKRLRHDIKNATTVCIPTTPASFDELHGLHANPAPIAVAEKVKQIAKGPKVDTTTLSRILARNRSVKQQVEIDAIQKAIDITLHGLQIVQQSYASYLHEYEIEAELSKQFRLGGGNGHAFSPIVANGGHATTLHYIANNGLLDHSLPTVIDVGADYRHYAADITRTILPIKPTQRQKAVYEAVKRVQDSALKLLRPGVLMRQYEAKVEDIMGKELVKLALIKSASDHHAIRNYFGHASSHFLGLDVHDTGLYGEPLEPNMIVTCEPGIYIPEEGFGVRIEDDVLITETGNAVMTSLNA
jgi:Xaa-Pro aminopeptidase